MVNEHDKVETITMEKVKVIKDTSLINPADISENIIFGMDVEKVLDSLPEMPLFDLVVTSPPYNIGKKYERKKIEFERYLTWQSRIITKIHARLKDTGSICWQVGNYIDYLVMIFYRTVPLPI